MIIFHKAIGLDVKKFAEDSRQYLFITNQKKYKPCFFGGNIDSTNWTTRSLPWFQSVTCQPKTCCSHWTSCHGLGRNRGGFVWCLCFLLVDLSSEILIGFSRVSGIGFQLFWLIYLEGLYWRHSGLQMDSINGDRGFQDFPPWKRPFGSQG